MRAGLLSAAMQCCQGLQQVALVVVLGSCLWPPQQCCSVFGTKEPACGVRVVTGGSGL